MGKKKYVKPEIREESYLLTVRAWVTTTQTSVLTQEVVNSTSVLIQEATTTTSVAIQRLVTRITSRLARRA